MDVEIKLFEAIDDCKEYAGQLVSYDKENITIAGEDKEYTFVRKILPLLSWR